MSIRIRSWFRRHIKAVTVHGLITSGFLLYSFFLAGPIFDRFDRTEGEAKLQKIFLPAESNNVVHNFNLIIRSDTIEAEGWAFIEGYGTQESKIYIVLKSGTKTYVFDTLPYKRTDITSTFQEFNGNLDDSGFIALISPDKISRGEYVFGIYIKKGEIEALQFTDKVVVRSKGKVGVTSRT